MAGSLHDQVIGVIDLRHGIAVHAVAGRRSEYRPVEIESVDSGDPFSLMDHYSRIGISRLYVADLDAICDDVASTANRQQQVLLGIADQDRWQEIVVDIGWRGPSQSDFANELCGANERVRVVVATETANDPSELGELAEHINASKILIGMDYFSGQFRGTDEGAWISEADRVGIRRFLPLDTANVGTGQLDSTLALCKRLRDLTGESEIYTGGGINSWNDVARLSAAGCSGCLAATWLYRLG